MDGNLSRLPADLPDAGDPVPADNPQYAVSRETTLPASASGASVFGISEEDFTLLYLEGIKASQEALNSRVNRTIDEMLDKQTGSPLRLNSDDMNRLGARFCEAVRQGAERMAEELANAVGNRRRLGATEREWIKEQVNSFISELTSPKAAHAFFAGQVAQNFTIANPQEAELSLRSGWQWPAYEE